MKHYFALIILCCLLGCAHTSKTSVVSKSILFDEILKSDSVVKKIEKVECLPKTFRKYLKEKGVILTEAGKKYNELDISFDSNEPNARMLYGGWVRKNLGFVIYESGGLTRQTNFVVFKTEKKILDEVAFKFITCFPRELQELKNCLR